MVSHFRRILRAACTGVLGRSRSGRGVGRLAGLVDEDTDEKVTYRIVGEYEADVKDGKVSITSPIARAVIGKEVGESVEVVTPNGSRSYEILGIKYK